MRGNTHSADGLYDQCLAECNRLSTWKFIAFIGSTSVSTTVDHVSDHQMRLLITGSDTQMLYEMADKLKISKLFYG
jgi:hypothetical protein